MTKEAMTLALEALKYPLNTSHEGFNVDMAELLAHRAIKALEEALAKQEQGEPDWKDQYEKQKRRAEMWIAKYEKDIGPLEYAVPAKQEQGEPVGYQQLFDAIAAATNTPYEGAVGISVSSFEKAIGSKIYTTPQQRKPLTDEEIGAILEGVNAYGTRLYTFARAIEAAHGIKGDA